VAIQETKVGVAAIPRLIGCFVGQKKRALVCPQLDDLTGRVMAITGASNGIGFETVKALIDAGATVLLMIRNETKTRALLNDLGNPPNTHVIPVDLSDLETVERAVQKIEAALKGKQIDTLIENAGVSPHNYEETAQGHEIAFGTNVLGHFVLRQALINSELLREDARVVVLTGDIYITTSDCTSDFKYRTPIGGSSAYSRSKLGNIWIAKILQSRYPKMTITLVHPGVVASGLMMGDGPIERIMKRLLLPTAMGAQTSLFCATQPVVNGGYYHNTCGLVHLSEKDPALNLNRAQSLWSECEAMAAPYLNCESPSHAA